MVTNITIGAPPGTITKGSRAPNFHGPKDCSRVPSPHSRKVALIRLTVSAADRPSALATRNTEVIGTAAITSTCCRPNSSNWEKGSTASTGAGSFARDMIVFLDRSAPKSIWAHWQKIRRSG